MSELGLPAPTVTSRPPLALGGSLVFGAAVLSALGACASVYFQARSNSTVWPPVAAPSLNNYIGLMTTITMLLSAMSAIWALTALRKNERRPAVTAVVFTTGFAVAGLNAMSFALRDLGFGPADSVYAIVFYAPMIVTLIFTVVGVASLINVTARLLGRRDGPGYAVKLKASVALWLVCVIAWLATYGLLYLVK